MSALLRFVCGPFRMASALDFSSLDAGGAFFSAKTPGVEAVFSLSLILFIPEVLRMFSSAWCLMAYSDYAAFSLSLVGGGGGGGGWFGGGRGSSRGPMQR
jgi:hypothetical protein